MEFKSAVSILNFVISRLIFFSRAHALPSACSLFLRGINTRALRFYFTFRYYMLRKGSKPLRCILKQIVILQAVLRFTSLYFRVASSQQVLVVRAVSTFLSFSRLLLYYSIIVRIIFNTLIVDLFKTCIYQCDSRKQKL